MLYYIGFPLLKWHFVDLGLNKSFTSVCLGPYLPIFPHVVETRRIKLEVDQHCAFRMAQSDANMDSGRAEAQTVNFC